MLCTGGALKCLELKCCDLYLCHFGKMAGAVGSADKGCPSMHCARAALMGQLELVCGRAPVLPEAAGQLWCPDPAHICTFKVEG